MATNVKCSISSLESSITVDAYFNPREIAFEKQIPWNEQKAQGADAPKLEFTDAAPGTLTVELLFDSYETGGNVHDLYCKKLQDMTAIMDGAEKRPPQCMFKWGTFPPFKGVIENLSIKYTMFFADGTPCRATATVKLKEFIDTGSTGGVDSVEVSSVGTEPGSTVNEGDMRRPDRYGRDHRSVMAANGSDDGRLTPGARVPGRQS